MIKCTKEQINDILGLKGWIDSQIDVFNLYAVLTIGVTNNIILEAPATHGKLHRKPTAKKP